MTADQYAAMGGPSLHLGDWIVNDTKGPLERCDYVQLMTAEQLLYARALLCDQSSGWRRSALGKRSIRTQRMVGLRKVSPLNL
ncbi:hypothetical protein [Pseudomonas azerbaijanoccidentalis]